MLLRSTSCVSPPIYLAIAVCSGRKQIRILDETAGEHAVTTEDDGVIGVVKNEEVNVASPRVSAGSASAHAAAPPSVARAATLDDTMKKEGAAPPASGLASVPVHMAGAPASDGGKAGGEGSYGSICPLIAPCLLATPSRQAQATR